MRRKKWYASVLAVAMAASLLSGCGNAGKEPEAGGSEASVKEETSKSEETSEEASEPEETPEEVPDEEPEVFKLTVQTSPEEGDWNDYWMIRHLEEMFNVDIQVEMISADIWNDKVPLMFATEELPDFFVNSLAEADITAYGKEGYLIDLTPYISEEKTPNIWKAMEEAPVLRAAVTELGGEIYGLNGADMGDAGRAKSRFYINYQWAEQILGKQPETLEEFYEYLKGVKERDMNGNGDATDEIPLGGCYGDSETIHIFPPILSAFGYTSREIEVIDGKVLYVPAEENYQHFLEFMHTLYAEGLLDNEYFSQSSDQADAKDTNYLYGACGSYASWVRQPDETIWRQYDIMEPLTSEYNDVKMTPAQDINIIGNFIITKKCKNPEKLMQIADWCFSVDGWMAIANGFEKGTVEGQEEYGYTCNWVDEKTVEVKVDYDEEKWDDLSDWRLAEVMPNWGLFPLYGNLNKVEGWAPQAYLEEGLRNHSVPYFHVGWPSSVKLSPEEADEIALIYTDIVSYTDEMVTKMINGEIATDEFGTFQNGLKERKLERMMEIYQTAYDRWSANQ